MNRKLNKILILILVLFCLNNCRVLESSITGDVQQYIKDWLCFDTGSWRVYREVNSGMIDSQYVTESKIIISRVMRIIKRNQINFQLIEEHINSGYYFFLTSIYGGSNVEKTSKSSSERLSTYLRYDPLRIDERKGTIGLGYTEIKNIIQKYNLNNTIDT